MPLDFTPYFNRYEILVKAVDQLFDQVAKDHPDQVRCGKGMQRLLLRSVRPDPGGSHLSQLPFQQEIRRHGPKRRVGAR